MSTNNSQSHTFLACIVAVISMAHSRSQNIFSYLSIYLLLHFSMLTSMAVSYTLPDHYFINCGSSFTGFAYQRNFTADDNSAGTSANASDSPSTADGLYQTARIFKKASFYELHLDQDGIYVVRLHFFPFPAMGTLSYASFNVYASGFSLLSISNVGNYSIPLVEEFLLRLGVGKFKIEFKPDSKKSFAFVNAIELFLAPSDFIRDSPGPPSVTLGGSEGNYDGVLKGALRVVHRINVGGGNVLRDSDTMMRYWIPDDPYLLHYNTARNKTYAGEIKYQLERATKFDAPDSVYNTAKEMNVGNDGNGLTNFNVTWKFEVTKGAQHLVRLHFCDIVSRTTNELFRMNLYIYSGFRKEVSPWDMISQLAAPFYMDYVVYSDDSGFMNISVGPSENSRVKTAFLNGVEIMELLGVRVPVSGGGGSTRKHLLVAVEAGGLILVVLVVSLLVVCLRKKKGKLIIEASEWGLIPLKGGSSHCSRTTARTVTGSVHEDLNLGLKVPLSSILFATRKFSAKMIIGKGGFGKVYKGKMRDGTKVAVKRSEEGCGQGLQEFHTEIMVLSKIKHQHLVSLIGYCDEKNEMILVYEFMEKGTLREHLYNFHGKMNVSTSKLSWDQRLKICIGAARGLHYLHTGSTETIVHRDIKSTNILLDENYVAKVADFGLSRSGSLDQTHFTTEVKGSFGYLDPECYSSYQLTKKSDVYSFGVVLLEVLCARPAVDTSLPEEQVNLADWGMSWQKKGQLERIADPFLAGKISPNSLRVFGETVEKCLENLGVDRPHMSDVLWCLEYCLQFQKSRQQCEDSTTDVSFGLPTSAVQRLPSNSMSMSEDEMAFRYCSFTDGSEIG